MFSFFKRLLHILSYRLRRKRQPVERMKERWIADFSHTEKSCFIIKPENSYNAYIENSPSGGSLFIGLKKNNCMVWQETVNRVYVNAVINAHFRYDSLGSYCAAGIMFRVTGQGTYYLALVSSKGFFRLDAVSNTIPKTLIGWVALFSDPPEEQLRLGITAKDDHFIFTINGKWIAETRDSSIPGGHFGFALVSYESKEPDTLPPEAYTCKGWLDYLSVDSRPGAVTAEYAQWNDPASAGSESRLRLAESFAAVGRFDEAYGQMLKAWKHTDIRTGRELLFAAQTASRLGKYGHAQKHIDRYFSMAESGKTDTNDLLEAFAQKAIILSALEKNSELAVFLPDYIKLAQKGTSADILPSLYALLGNACWNLNDYGAAAKAWGKAASLDKTNSLYAAKAREAKRKER